MPSQSDQPSWFDGARMIGMLKDGYVGHNAIVVITNRADPAQLCPKQGTCESVASMNEFYSYAKKEAGSNVHVLVTNKDQQRWQENDFQIRDATDKKVAVLGEILMESSTCKYKKPDGLKPDSVIFDNKRSQIAPCTGDANKTCDGWKEVSNSANGSAAYIEVQGNACKNLRESLMSMALSARTLGGYASEAPLYISSR